MGQKYVTIDENDVIQEPYDEVNGNVPDGALPITDFEFKQLSAGFDMFKHVNGVLISNTVKVEEILREQLVTIEEQKVIVDLISTAMLPKLAQINNMNAVALKAAIAAGGLT